MNLFGFFNVDKPLGMTSHDVVARIRRAAKTHFDQRIKVGHAGTLDPLATGVLVVCMGAATRLSDYVMDTTKRYSAQVRLGISTTTYDAEGEITAERDATTITREQVVESLAQFIGDIEQIPPMYSAIKQGGKKLYELAREGKTVERAGRAVHIADITLTDWAWPECTLDVICGAGTYIRSLAHDLGESLGCGAHLTGLTRTASGSFTLENAVMLDALLTDPDWESRLIRPESPLIRTGWPQHSLSEAQVADLKQGRAILLDKDTSHQYLEMLSATVSKAPTAYLLGMTPDGVLATFLEADTHDNGIWQPRKVFLNVND